MILKRIPATIHETATIYQGSNGQEAVDLYYKHKPDIVFLDLTMPVMDGFEALTRIKKYDKSAVVHIVTADIQGKAREKVLDAGATAIDNKPIEKERLAEIFTSLKKDRTP